MSNNPESLHYYPVWDRPVRLFHWVNVLCVLGLAAIGLVILYSKSFGVSADGKILLKTIHTYFGYVFAINLSWRMVWAFMGNPYARWKALLPFGKGYGRSLLAYVNAFKADQLPPYLGHNPLARLMVFWLFLLLTTQAVTGLILAGTDLYLPPFGHEIAEWVTGAGEDHSRLRGLKPGSKEGLDPEAYQAMREFRKPVVNVHKYGFYLLALSILLHIAGVVVAELKEKNALVSAMLTGKKVFTKPPVDLSDDENNNSK